MKLVHVITSAPTSRGRTVRLLVGRIAARIVSLLTTFGHVLAVAVVALDVLLTALLGLPPLIPAVRGGCRRLRQALWAAAAGVVETEIVDDNDRQVRH